MGSRYRVVFGWNALSASIITLAFAITLLACSGGNNGKHTPAGSSTPNSLTACAPGTSTATGSIKIGSKPFAEQQLLATMTKLVLEKHGFTVNYTTQASDPAIDRALHAGTIDALWQYTGTELQLFLGESQPPTDLAAAFNLAREKDAEHKLCWIAPAPLNDTNGLAIRARDRANYGSTLTEFGRYLQTHPEATVCIMTEFRTRTDGLPGLRRTYPGYDGPNFKDINGTAESAIAAGDCTAGQVFTTNSAIVANDLYVLEDDRKLFPPDNVGLIVRAETLQRYPSIATLMTPVAAKLTTEEIMRLNKLVEVDKQSVDVVARIWLQQNGYL